MTSSCNVVDEIWKSVKDFPGYEVSDHGRVKSFHKLRAFKAKHGRILSPALSHGYARVNLVKDGKRYMKAVHRLILEAYMLEIKMVVKPLY